MIEAEGEGDDLFLAEEGTAAEAGFLGAPEVLEELASGELPITPTQAFALFFSDNAREFDDEHYRRNGRSEVVVGKWTKSAEFGRVRELRYVVAIKGAPMGPPSSPVEETQRLFMSRSHLVVESSTSTHGVPFADYFRTLTRYDLAATGTAAATRVRISAGLSFSKRTILKGTISAFTIKQVREVLNNWVLLAKEWVDSHPLPALPPSPSLSSAASTPTPTPPPRSLTAPGSSAAASASSAAEDEASSTTTSTTTTTTTVTKDGSGATTQHHYTTWVTTVVHAPVQLAMDVKDVVTARDLVWLLLLFCVVLYFLRRLAALEVLCGGMHSPPFA